MTQIHKRSEMRTELGVPEDVIPITPSDTTVYTPPLRAIRCDTGGTLAVVTAAGNTRSMKFANGETREIKVSKVLSTGTLGPANIEGLL